MNWEDLLSLKRYGDTHKRIRKEQDQTRLGFEVDYDRIIFSSEFRSLQDKTQVVPLSRRDFVHTRLTHSLEVSVVGRSLGRQVGQRILDRHPHLQNIHGFQIHDFGAIVSAAALAHDIGNPPFGHSGEKAIGRYFKKGEGQQFKAQLTDAQFQDLCDFEGNANGFRILTENRPGRPGGLRLSYATLGAFIKYPKESLPKQPTAHIAHKKFGVFQSESEFFKSLAIDLGLSDETTSHVYRHPLAFLVEAADDICYTIIDFEDAINCGWIEESYALEYLIKLVKYKMNVQTYNSMKLTKDRVSYLRALAIGALIDEAVDVFMSNEEGILSGKYSIGLLDKCKYEAQITDIKNLSIQNMYQSPEVVDKEIAGYEVLTHLLSVYCSTLVQFNSNDCSQYEHLILKTLPEAITSHDAGLYEQLISVCGYVAIMSDSQAVMTYNTLKGLKF